MADESDASEKGINTRKMRKTLSSLGVNKSKYQTKLEAYEHSKQLILTEIYRKAHELAKYTGKELKETKEVLKHVEPALEKMGKLAEAFEALANDLRRGDTAKSTKDARRELGGINLKNSVKGTINQFKQKDKEIEKMVKEIGKAMVKDEEDLEKVLFLTEYLSLLFKYYYEVDKEIKTYRWTERAINRKDRAQIERETRTAVQQATSDGEYEQRLKQNVDTAAQEL